ncbi:lysophospholipid acyltransferase family protein [Flavobacterium caeni]|uniref:Uncharacterized protein n=1 Tax=Flavobacterium caeni TaxID=490189 RepID=A0A1G5HSG4_9FLAO|nr:hypothetical protein [Flavobacterium caeni]SCY66664.1 hypothetical protein SAMN02927903_01982 [Flavobacterium caeni]
MNNIDFLDNVARIKENIYGTKLDDLEIDGNGLLWSFLVVSCNLSTFLPGLNAEDHYNMVQNMQFHRSLSGADLYFPSLLNNTRFYDKSDVLAKSKQTPHIFVSYHAGSYYMILRHLAMNDNRFCVVAGDNYIRDYESFVQDVYRDVPNSDTSALQIMSAHDPKLLLKLSKKLNDGVSVFFFIDGNSGTKQNNFASDKNLLKIDFLHHHIYARQGVALLAYLTKAPVATIIAKRDKRLNNSVIIKPVNTDRLLAKKDRNHFVNSVTRKLYGELERYLYKNYEQWSGWFYIHELFDGEAETGPSTASAPETEYNNTPFVVSDAIRLIKHKDESIFMVNRKSYEIMQIGSVLFDVLTFFRTPQQVSTGQPLVLNGDVIGFDFVKELIALNLIKQA